MKKLALLSLAVATAIALGGCGDKQQLTEKDLETISEKQVEQAFEKMENQVSKEAKSKEQTQKETETDKIDLNEPGVSIAVDDPYEMNLFEFFGLDNDFPKPNENYGIKSSYSTTGYQIDGKTGEQKEGIQKSTLWLGESEKYYSDYRDQVVTYLKEKKPDLETNPRENTWPNYFYKIDNDYYGVVNVYGAGNNKTEIYIQKFAYTTHTLTTTLGKQYSSDFSSWTNKDGITIKTQKISVKDDESSFLLIYRSDTHPDLPYDLKEGTTVTVTFDEIEEYRPNYDRVNSIVIE